MVYMLILVVCQTLAANQCVLIKSVAPIKDQATCESELTRMTLHAINTFKNNSPYVGGACISLIPSL